MGYYSGNASGLSKEDIGVFPKPPYYWWEAGAAWGALIEYTQLTGDKSYVETLHQALVTNYGPDKNLILDWKRDQEGNDDQAFWALSVMSAVEYNFPEPADTPATYLEIAINAWNNMVSRWDTTSCGGGFKWQIYPDNPSNGYNYKNSISNGAIFALGARLARYTGNQTYAEWSTKIFDWTKAIGLISDEFEVFDGTDDNKNCTEMDHTQWSYNIGMMLHGVAVMHNITSGDAKWKKYVEGFGEHIGKAFIDPYNNASHVLYERACETDQSDRVCNVDQYSFKAYISRFMSKTSIMAPGLDVTGKFHKWLKHSAEAAGKACTGGVEGTKCGHKWYTKEWDGTDGVGQQMNALEVTQALLTLRYGIAPGTAEQHSDPAPAPTLSSSTSPLPLPSPSSTSALHSTQFPASTFSTIPLSPSISSSNSNIPASAFSTSSSLSAAAFNTFNISTSATTTTAFSTPAIPTTAPASTTEIPFIWDGPSSSQISSIHLTPSIISDHNDGPWANSSTMSAPSASHTTKPKHPHGGHTGTGSPETPPQATGVPDFDGAATSVKIGGVSVVVAVAFAAVCGGLI